MKDYYQTLGVSRSASEEEIKKAYRKLAHQHHPDKPGGDEARFKEINEAYQVLSDKEKRARYDRYGSAEGPQMPGGGQGFPGGFTWDFGGQGFPGGGGFSDLGDIGDIFETFFGGGRGPGRGGRTYRRGADIETEISITLSEAFHGAHRNAELKTLVTCDGCRGKGSEPGVKLKKCGTCGGQGQVQEERRTFFGQFSQVKTCSACSGSGEVPEQVCKACSGKGRKPGMRSFRVDVAPGIQEGQIIKISGAGEAGEQDSGSGDVYVHIKIKPDKDFEREGDDLIVRKEIGALDLLLSRKIVITGIDGRHLQVDIPNAISANEPLRVVGEGMPHLGRSGRGDLLVELTIKLPKKISAKDKALLEKIEKEI